ncbi:MAG: 3-dehydroquinate synthase [Deltaproteobacteria bacterium]|nr:3-dehydroquinate synthase [Deltaproteobacteria bacterium]
MTPETRTVTLGDRSYDIFFDRNIYPNLQEWICRFHPGGSVYVVTDRNVASIYGDDIRRWLAGIPHDVLALPPGEEHRILSTVGRIYEFLAEGNAGRDSLVVAFGGGVIGDLAGFAAATFLRGISFVQVPTTLLSQVDSSVGGKTGFNLPEGKNLVGAFHQPRAVFIDDTFLLTLDDRNLRAGLAEVVKCGLAGDAELWERLIERDGRWKSFSGDDWQWLIRRAVSYKASVVERDERETSLRKVLNLGHTIGHSLEQAGGYGRLLHGEAVAMGLAWEAVLGRRLGVTGEDTVDGIVSLLLHMGFDLDVPGIPLSSIAAAIGADKKRVESDIDLPLIVRPGTCEIRRTPLTEIRRELSGIRAEIRERLDGRECGKREAAAGEVPETVQSLERRVAADPRDTRTITLLADAYRRSGNLAAAWEAIQEVLERDPSDAEAQRVASELGKSSPVQAGESVQATLPLENLVLLDEDAYEIRVADAVAPLGEEGENLRAPEPPAVPPVPSGAGPIEGPDEPPAPLPGTAAAAEKAEAAAESLPVPSVWTVTLADVYWAQGERATARKIVRQILMEDPQNERALAWKAAHGMEDPVESALGAFLDTTAKEYGYDLSRHH